ncbi:MAG: hypothetical protein WBM35_12020, partial [Candidatus Electrothrix sp.]
MHGNDRTLLNQGLEYIEIVQKKGYHYAPLTQVLKPVFQQQLGLNEVEKDRGALNTFDNHPLEFFIFNLIFFWTDKDKMRSESSSHLSAIRDKAEKNGYTW